MAPVLPRELTNLNTDEGHLREAVKVLCDFGSNLAVLYENFVKGNQLAIDVAMTSGSPTTPCRSLFHVQHHLPFHPNAHRGDESMLDGAFGPRLWVQSEALTEIGQGCLALLPVLC